MSEELKKIKNTIFNDFHSVRFYDLFHKGENMHHSIFIYSSKKLVHETEITKNHFSNYVSQIMHYYPEQI